MTAATVMDILTVFIPCRSVVSLRTERYPGTQRPALLLSLLPIVVALQGKNKL